MDSLSLDLLPTSALSVFLIVLIAVLIVGGFVFSAIASRRDQFPGRRQGGGTHIQPPDYPDDLEDGD